MKMSARAQATAANYRGATARGYEAKRLSQEKWHGEDRILREWLDGWSPGTSVLDIPVGTGRFLPYYVERGFEVVGIDVSPDMLAEARRKTDANVLLMEGNVLSIGLTDASVDIAVCVRLLNMIDRDEMAIALRELQRVARKAVIVSLRVGGDEGRLTRPAEVEDVAAALAPGWRIDEDQAVHKPRYRMIRLCR